MNGKDFSPILTTVFVQNVSSNRKVGFHVLYEINEDIPGKGIQTFRNLANVGHSVYDVITPVKVACSKYPCN